jgi:hypothetical protein
VETNRVSSKNTPCALLGSMSPLDEEIENEAPSTKVIEPTDVFLTVGSPAKVQGSFTA